MDGELIQQKNIFYWCDDPVVWTMIFRMMRGLSLSVRCADVLFPGKRLRSSMAVFCVCGIVKMFLRKKSLKAGGVGDRDGEAQRVGRSLLSLDLISIKDYNL